MTQAEKALVYIRLGFTLASLTSDLESKHSLGVITICFPDGSRIWHYIGRGPYALHVAPPDQNKP